MNESVIKKKEGGTSRNNNSPTPIFQLVVTTSAHTFDECESVASACWDYRFGVGENPISFVLYPN